MAIGAARHKVYWSIFEKQSIFSVLSRCNIQVCVVAPLLGGSQGLYDKDSPGSEGSCNQGTHAHLTTLTGSHDSCPYQPCDWLGAS